MGNLESGRFLKESFTDMKVPPVEFLKAQNGKVQIFECFVILIVGILS